MVEQEFAAIRELRKDCLIDSEEWASGLDVGPGKLRPCLKAIVEHIATGADSRNLRNLLALPDIALDQLGTLFKQALSLIALPWHPLLVILNLLGKNLRVHAPLPHLQVLTVS